MNDNNENTEKMDKAEKPELIQVEVIKTPKPEPRETLRNILKIN